MLPGVYSLKYERTAENLAEMERLISLEKPTIVRHTVGKHWIFSVGHHPTSWAHAWHRGKLFGLTGHVVGFLPPGSIVEWHISACHRNVRFYISNAKIPDDLPAEPIAFSMNADPAIQSVDQIFSLIRENRSRSFPIRCVAEESRIAVRAKALIFENFLRGVSLGQIAGSMGIRPETLTRSFEAAYRLSPARYRKGLRLFDALGGLVLSGDPIIQLALESGYENLGLFNRHFRKSFRMTPTHFRATSMAAAGDLVFPLPRP